MGAEILRRASYGPTSPQVGRRGARTRQLILDTALELFEERGFRATLVEDIAAALGISRATLYQYFESKEQLFMELLGECGSALLRVVRRLGPMSPTAEGYDNLHWWLGECAWVYERYATMFDQWTRQELAGTPVRSMIADFVDRYVERLSPRIAATDIGDLDPRALAVALLAVITRVNFYARTGADRGLTSDQLLDTMATCFQLVLFPDTPAAALVHTAEADHPSHARLVRVPRTDPGAPGRPVRRTQPLDVRLAVLSPRAAGTVHLLLDAGAVLFAAGGYHGASVEDIAGRAGVSRGTFYKYFDDKLDLLLCLTDECGQVMIEAMDRFAGLGAGRGPAPLSHGGEGQGPPGGLTDWLTAYVDLHGRYAGLFGSWIEQEPPDPVLQAVGQRIGTRILSTFDTVLGRVDRSYPFEVRGGSLILLALLERLPHHMAGEADRLDRETLVATLEAVMRRGLFNGHPPLT